MHLPVPVPGGPLTALKPLWLRCGKVCVHRRTMGLTALVHACNDLAPANDVVCHVGMLLCGVGSSSLLSIVLAIDA